MAKIMTSSEFVKRAKDVAEKYKTLYILGCFGAPMNATNKKRYTGNYKYNAAADRKAMIEKASADTFGFDCVCLVKGLLWGWCGDKNKVYGGAVYESNGVPDTTIDAILAKCTDVSTDFSKIVPGEYLYMDGHVGIYIGDGLAVECSPAWKNCVQITAVNKAVPGYNIRIWKKHGKLPWIDYTTAPETKPVYPAIVCPCCGAKFVKA